ncbi:MAG: Mom family adenine methylcarbamoylation protein [Candidatus Cryosericum sp.]
MSKTPSPRYDLRACPLKVVNALCVLHHGYGGASATATYAFAVYEDGKAVAAYAWQPPPPGAAKNICPEAPWAVLALSRMVAVDRTLRKLKHVSTPLRRQMRVLIDRGRWPVLVTYHDEGQGHTGHVYKCSGWTMTREGESRAYYVDSSGNRASRYANGKTGDRGLRKGGMTRVHRWEHWACKRGEAAAWILAHGWKRVPVLGKVWRSGNPAYRWEKAS